MEDIDGEVMWPDEGGEGTQLAPGHCVPALAPARSAGVFAPAQPAPTQWAGGMQVDKPRVMADVERAILKQAALLGAEAFYAWGAGKGRVEGPSIELAMVMLNAYGNASTVAEPVQETAEAWYFTHWFIDHEAKVATARQWRENKRSRVDGNLDAERKDAIRFNRGQPKNIRNVIVQKMPRWLVHKAMEEAKRGSRERMEKFIRDKGLAAAQTYTVQQLKRYGVTEEQILEKMGKVDVTGLDLEDLVMLSADFKVIESGQEHDSTVYPVRESAVKMDLKEKLKAKVEPPPKDPDAQAVEEMRVGLGPKPYTWLVSDGVREYLVRGLNDGKSCNCTTPEGSGCLHLMAAERFDALNR